MSRLGALLKQLRGELSLFDVEKVTGIHRFQISRYENGKNIPAIETLKKLAECYGEPYQHLRKAYFEDLASVDADDKRLLIEWAYEQKTPNDEHLIVAKFKRLSPSSQKSLLAELQNIYHS